MSFEIITSQGERLRYDGNEYAWQYGLKAGTKDVSDKDIVEVVDEDGNIVLRTFRPQAVGDVDQWTALVMPSECRTSKCPRCGFTEYE